MSTLLTSVPLDRNLTVKRLGVSVPVCDALRLVVWEKEDGAEFIRDILEAPTLDWIIGFVRNNRAAWSSLGYRVSLESVIFHNY
jgi:hypothetical protein